MGEVQVGERGCVCVIQEREREREREKERERESIRKRVGENEVRQPWNKMQLLQPGEKVLARTSGRRETDKENNQKRLWEP